jgi:hypothetical protein
MPLLAVDTSDPRTGVLPLNGKLPPRVVGVAWHRDRIRSAAAESFVELAAQVCDELHEAAPAAVAG